MVALVYHISSKKSSVGGIFMRDILDILCWSVARFFLSIAKSAPPTPLVQYGDRCGSFCADAISGVVESRGRRWLLPANIALFTLGLLALCADDYLLAHTLSCSFRLLGIALACLFMTLHFDAWRVRDPKNLLKLLYIIISGLGGACTSLTYFFLVIYENIIAYRIWGGI